MSSTRRPMIVVLALAALAAALVLVLVISGVLPTGSDTEAGGPSTSTAEPDVVATPGTAETAPPSEEVDPDRFVITYDEDSPIAEILAGVETYGQDILADLPPEQQAAILAAAQQVSVTVEAITAHSGDVAAIDLSEGLTPEQVEQFTALLEQIESITSVEPDLQLTPLGTTQQRPQRHLLLLPVEPHGPELRHLRH